MSQGDDKPVFYQADLPPVTVPVVTSLLQQV